MYNQQGGSYGNGQPNYGGQFQWQGQPPPGHWSNNNQWGGQRSPGQYGGGYGYDNNQYKGGQWGQQPQRPGSNQWNGNQRGDNQWGGNQYSGQYPNNNQWRPQPPAWGP
ncbi:unnamed protein product [Sphagnum balticum]